MSRLARRLARASMVGTAAFALGVIGAPLSAQDDDVTTLDSVYTTEQAEKGRELYQKACAGCHTLDWYTGDIVRAWEGGSLFGLYEVIQSTMPQDNPGSLRNREYVELLAYILELNGLPAGETPLSSRRSRLRAIRFQFEKENH